MFTLYLKDKKLETYKSHHAALNAYFKVKAMKPRATFKILECPLKKS